MLFKQSGFGEGLEERDVGVGRGVGKRAEETDGRRRVACFELEMWSRAQGSETRKERARIKSEAEMEGEARNCWSESLFLLRAEEGWDGA